MERNSFKKINLYTCNLPLILGTLKFNYISKMSFKNLEYVSQKVLLSFLNIEKLLKLFLAYYNIYGEILQINKVKPRVQRGSCKYDHISEIKLKMFCNEDTKAVNSPINLTLTIYNQYGTSLQ